MTICWSCRDDLILGSASTRCFQCRNVFHKICVGLSAGAGNATFTCPTCSNEISRVSATGESLLRPAQIGATNSDTDTSTAMQPNFQGFVGSLNEDQNSTIIGNTTQVDVSPRLLQFTTDPQDTTQRYNSISRKVDRLVSEIAKLQDTVREKDSVIARLQATSTAPIALSDQQPTVQPSKRPREHDPTPLDAMIVDLSSVTTTSNATMMNGIEGLIVRLLATQENNMKQYLDNLYSRIQNIEQHIKPYFPTIGQGAPAGNPSANATLPNQSTLGTPFMAARRPVAQATAPRNIPIAPRRIIPASPLPQRPSRSRSRNRSQSNQRASNAAGTSRRTRQPTPGGRTPSKTKRNASVGFTTVVNKKKQRPRPQQQPAVAPSDLLPLSTIITQSKRFSEVVRNVSAVEQEPRDPEMEARIIDEISYDRDIERIGFVRVIRRSHRLLIFVSENETKAELLDNLIANRYTGKAVCKAVSPIKHLLLVTKMAINQDDNPASLLESFLVSNPWLSTTGTTYERHWDVKTKRGVHNHVVFAMTAQDQLEALKRKSLKFRLFNHAVYEYNNLSQCHNCWRFGHLLHECRFAPACRTCGGEHATATCVIKNAKCANCKRFNSNPQNANQKRSTKHRPTDRRCPDFLMRVSGLKSYWSAL